MCGIVGLLHKAPDSTVADDVLAKMCRAIVHRGPDGEGSMVAGNVGMAMRRLAIIDLSGGKQPMYNEDGQVAVVFNGEIYNHQDLRETLIASGHQFRTRSDTEVLVHGYEEWGDRLPERLNGMFAFSIWDARHRRLTIARDHIGVKPLYLYEDEKQWVWGSEIKALLEAPGVAAELDQQGLLDFLRFGYVPAPRTMFRRIRKIEPATVLTIEDGRLSERKYWDVGFAAENQSVDAWGEQLRELLDDAVNRQLMSDVPLGAFLSGGLDSSSIVASMHRQGVQHIATYAIGFGGEDAFHSELSKAAAIARQFGTDHHEIVVEPDATELLAPLIHQLDEPFTDTSFLVTYLVSKMARETVTVILSGVGGDEIFAGYRRYLGPQLQQWYGMIPGLVRRKVVQPLVRRLPVDRGSRMKSLFRYARGFTDQAEMPEDLRYEGYVTVFNGERTQLLTSDLRAMEPTTPSHHVADYYTNAPATDPLNRMLYADLKTSLVDSLLTFTDKMTMAVSLEARVPLLDHRLVELMARIPSEVKLTGMRGLKHVFKHAMADRLPAEIIRQRKQGFGTPISRWFRSSLRPMLRDMLSPEAISRRGYFDPRFVQQLMDDHDHQRADHSEHLLALLTFEIWHQQYLDN